MERIATTDFNSSVIWMWKINKNDPWYFPRENEFEETGWIPYTDAETAFIEEKFQEKVKAAIFNDYRIDFKHFMQISNWDNRRERMVKRRVPQIPAQTTQEAQPKNMRFSLNSLLPTKSFVRWDEHDLSYLLFGFSDNFDSASFSLQDPCTRQRLVEKAAKGLIIEGGGKGENMAQELLSVKNGTLEQVTQKCAALYTREGFLYRELNTFMRLDGDRETRQLLRTKLKTLRPFALLLCEIPPETSEEVMTVYRSVFLDDAMIEQYREWEGTTDFVFPAFTSASRKMEVAEFYGGNVILMIDIKPRYDAVDISSSSQFPEECEMLLNAYFSFRILACTYDIDRNKWTIHLQSIRICNEH